MKTLIVKFIASEIAYLRLKRARSKYSRAAKNLQRFSWNWNTALDEYSERIGELQNLLEVLPVLPKQGDRYAISNNK